jgi:hypothetical protein
MTNKINQLNAKQKQLKTTTFQSFPINLMKRVNLIVYFVIYLIQYGYQVDGKETLGENMADGGGIKMAYRVRFHS